MEFTDSAVYIAIAGPSFILWAVGMVFGAGVVPLSLGVALLIESLRGRKLRASHEDSPERVQAGATELRAIQRADLRNKVCRHSTDHACRGASRDVHLRLLLGMDAVRCVNRRVRDAVVTVAT